MVIMTDNGFEGLPPVHPEMTGQELDTIPVTLVTIKKLRTTIDGLLGKTTNRRFTSPDNTYHLIRVDQGKGLDGTVGSISSKPIEDVHAPETIFTITQQEEAFDLQKDTIYPITPSDHTEESTNDLTERIASRAAAAVDTANAAADAADRNKSDMEELTGLPHISEGEIRALIKELTSDDLQPQAQ